MRARGASLCLPGEAGHGAPVAGVCALDFQHLHIVARHAACPAWQLDHEIMNLFQQHARRATSSGKDDGL